MDNKTILYRRNPNIFSSKTRAEFHDNFDMLKKYKNIFKKHQNLFKKKKYFVNTPFMYRSFLYSSSPYNYSKIPKEKNTFLIRYNGGPKIYSYVEKDKLNEEMDKQDIIYGESKPCGCFTKLYVPKLRRSLSNLEQYQNNNMKQYGLKRNMSSYGKRNFLYNKYYLPNAIKRNFNNITSLRTSKFDNSKNIYNNYNQKNSHKPKITYDKKKLLESCNYDSLLYQMNKNIDKKFHKTQIFDHCKPFLSEGL